MGESNELVEAASTGKVGRVNTLLNAGADVNAVGRNWDALHAAIATQRFWCVATLIKRGANIETLNLGLTPLALAVDTAVDCSNQCDVRYVPTDVIKLLLEAGADPEPGLKVAKDYQCKELIELLEAATKKAG